jgi:hypothetical protein
MRLALRFISGKYQGGEFPIEENREIIVGRSSDLDMVLVEDMVSRKHAQMKLVDGAILIEDLGSTNGTFVNGERITQAKLTQGDRILIGSNILKVVAVDETQLEARNEVFGARMSQRRSESSSEAKMSGELEEIPLPDLLQLFASSKKTALLNLRGETLAGRIYLKQGVLHFAEIQPLNGSGKTIVGLKALYRMICWERGLFELNPPDTRTFEHPLDTTVQMALMEGFRQKDELEQLKPRLPALDAKIVLAHPLPARLSSLTPAELEVLQSAIDAQTFGATLDASLLPDLDTSTLLLSLIERGYLALAS